MYKVRVWVVADADELDEFGALVFGQIGGLCNVFGFEFHDDFLRRGMGLPKVGRVSEA